jgi:hypothetical protein
VIRLDLGMVTTESLELFKSNLCMLLKRIAVQNGLSEIPRESPNEILIDLVQTLAEKEQVVLLIDEYDRPILNTLSAADKAQIYSDFLKDFYATVKALQPYLRFTFITGVSRFAKTSIFSGMNHLAH